MAQNNTNDDNVYMAKLAEQAERYEEMVKFMRIVASKKRAETGSDLSLEERNLLSVAYKNVVGARRASLRIISSVEQKGDNKDESKMEIIRDYKKQVGAELESICREILNILEQDLIVDSDSLEAEPKVFYQKMRADYYRYLAEFAYGDQKKEHAGQAENSYTEAQKASETLAPTHPIRLGLALNYSVFLYEVQEQKQDACRLAKDAFDKAIAELDTLDEESYKDSTLIMQLLRDNLTLWTSEEERD